MTKLNHTIQLIVLLLGLSPAIHAQINGRPIALRAHNGQYVCAEGSGGRELVANRNARGEWETFIMEELGNGRVALRAFDGQYVCAEGGGGGNVIANRHARAQWETFQLIRASNGKVGFKTRNGHYLCAEGGGGRELVANRTRRDVWETFTIEYLGPATNFTKKEMTAKRFAPLLYFDSKQGTSDYCFPSDARMFTRLARNVINGGGKAENMPISNKHVCNCDYNSIRQNRIPVFYTYYSEGSTEYVMYWFFYGWQTECIGNSGSHISDWERIAVKIENGNLARVMFFQHSGHYTRKRGRFELFNGIHPIAWVGKNSHGSYHDDGGTGGCCYWEDFRKPGKNAKSMQTWHNLMEAHTVSELHNSIWDHFYQPPTYTSPESLPNFRGCSGQSHKDCHSEQGCYKSDVSDDEYW